MIGMGIYCLVTAKKPKNRDQIRNGRFSLSAALRKKLMKLKELTDEKSRRKKGMGSTLLATCCVPIFIGAALDSMWYVYNNSFADSRRRRDVFDDRLRAFMKWLWPAARKSR